MNALHLSSFSAGSLKHADGNVPASRGPVSPRPGFASRRDATTWTRGRASRLAFPRGAWEREGFILHEVLIAILIVLAAMVGVAQLLALVAQQRRLAQQRTAAVREAGNLMEDLASRPWAEITVERLADVRLSDACQRRLPDATLHVEVHSEDADSQRISIRIDWPTGAGLRGEPVRLVAWRFRDEEVGP